VAVGSRLRYAAISYSKKARNEGRERPSASIAYVYPTCPRAAAQYAALPLIIRLNENQKSKCGPMAHGMGLDGVAPRRLTRPAYQWKRPAG